MGWEAERLAKLEANRARIAKELQRTKKRLATYKRNKRMRRAMRQRELEHRRESLLERIDRINIMARNPGWKE